MKKRILSMLLAIVMVVGLVPEFAVTASAADGNAVAAFKYNADSTFTEYTNLSDALNALNSAESGKWVTFKLMKNAEWTAENNMIINSAATNITFDLNGYTLDLGDKSLETLGSSSISISGSSNTAIYGAGKITSSASATVIAGTSGGTTLSNSVNIENTNADGFAVRADQKVVPHGATMTAKKAMISYNGGVINVQFASGSAYSFYNATNATVSASAICTNTFAKQFKFYKDVTATTTITNCDAGGVFWAILPCGHSNVSEANGVYTCQDCSVQMLVKLSNTDGSDIKYYSTLTSAINTNWSASRPVLTLLGDLTGTSSVSMTKGNDSTNYIFDMNGKTVYHRLTFNQMKITIQGDGTFKQDIALANDATVVLDGKPTIDGYINDFRDDTDHLCYTGTGYFDLSNAPGAYTVYSLVDITAVNSLTLPEGYGLYDKSGNEITSIAANSFGYIKQQHSHEWEYRKNDDATIEATCTVDGCGLYGGSVTIKAPIGYSAENPLVYNGAEQNATLSGSFTTGEIITVDNITYTGNKKPLDVGEYTANITVGGAAASVSYAIAAATPTVMNWATVKTPVYVNDTAAVLNDDGSAVGVKNEAVSGTFTLGTVDLTTDGEKTVTITFTPDSPNYKSVVKTDYKVNVLKRTVKSVEILEDITNKLYGTEEENLGLPDAVSITTEDGKTFHNVPVTWNGYNAATLDEQTLTGKLDLSGIDAEVEQPEQKITASVKIQLQEKNPQTVNFTDKSVTYNGSPVTHTLPDGLEGVKSITYSYKGIGTTNYAESSDAPTKVGTYEVTAVFEMMPGYAAVANKTANLTITPKALTVKAEGQDIAYGGSIVSSVDKVTVDGLVTGDILAAITLRASTTSVTANGTITPENAIIRNTSGADVTDCYAITYTPGLLTIGLVLDRIEVTAQPKLNYTEGDTLDLSGMVVTAYYTDGSSAPLAYTDVTTSIVNGTMLTTNEDGLTITIIYNSKTTATAPLTVQQRKAESDDDYWLMMLLMLMNQRYDVTATATDGGAITPAGVTEVKYNQDITYTITPADGYTIADVIVDDESIGAVSVYKFDNVRKDHEITAVFAEIPWQNPYSDVSENDWFYEDVQFVDENALMNGTVENELFAPELTATRAMIVTILWRLEGKPVVDSPVDFFDVPENEWYTDAINWASANGIVLGYDGLFHPENPITREQLAAILHRYAAYKGMDNGVIFPMIPQYEYSEWAENDVIWADMNGMLDGIGSDMTDMTADASRAEVAAMLRRFCERFAAE